MHFVSVSVHSEQPEDCFALIYKTEVKNREIFTEMRKINDHR